MKFSVKLAPMTINHVPGHWSWKKRERERWQWHFAEPKAQAVNFVFYAKQKRRVTVQVFWAKPGRLPDRDNLVAGLKPVVDALVKMGFLYDDSPTWVDIEYLPTLRAKKSSTEFEII